MKRFALILVLLLCPAIGLAGPFASAPVYRIDSSGNQHAQTSATASTIRTAYNAGGSTDTTYIMVEGTYDFDDTLLTGEGKIVGNSPTGVILEFDATIAELSALYPKCWGVTIRANDGDRVLGFPVGSDGTLVTDLRLRIGTAAEIEAIVLSVGEPAWKTDTFQLVVGDGVTAGGRPASSAETAVKVVFATGLGSRSFFPASSSQDDTGEAIEAARDFATEGDLVVVFSHGLVTSNLAKELVRWKIETSGQITRVSGSVFDLSSEMIVEIENNGIIQSGDDDAISVSHADAGLIIKGTGIVRAVSSGKTGIRFTAGVGEVYSGYFHGDSAGITISGGSVSISPAAAGIVSGSFTPLGLLGKTPGAGFLSLIPTTDAAGIRNTAGASGGIFPSTAGGTGNGFTKFSGPATSEKTFTLPNSNATILHGTPNGIVKGDGSGGTSAAVAGTDYGMPHLAYAAGKYYPSPLVITGTDGTALAAGNTLYLHPYSVDRPTQFVSAHIWIRTTGGTSGQIGRIGIWALDSSLEPTGEAIAETASFSIEGTGAKGANFGSPVTLQPGVWYVVGFSGNGTTAAPSKINVNALYRISGGAAPDMTPSGGTGIRVGWSQSSVDPASSMPSIGSLSNVFAPSVLPVIHLRVATP